MRSKLYWKLQDKLSAFNVAVCLSKGYITSWQEYINYVEDPSDYTNKYEYSPFEEFSDIVKSFMDDALNSDIQIICMDQHYAQFTRKYINQWLLSKGMPCPEELAPPAISDEEIKKEFLELSEKYSDLLDKNNQSKEKYKNWRPAHNLINPAMDVLYETIEKFFMDGDTAIEFKSTEELPDQSDIINYLNSHWNNPPEDRALKGVERLFHNMNRQDRSKN